MDLPQTSEQWQEAVNISFALLSIDSARAYGLITGGPTVNVERCEEIIVMGDRLGFKPQDEEVKRFALSLTGRPA